MPWKDADDRITDTVDYIEEVEREKSKLAKDTTGGGVKLVRRLCERLSSQELKQISEAMSIGSDVKALLPDKAQEKERRSAIRAVLLLSMAVWGEPVGQAKTLMAQYAGMTTDKLDNAIMLKLPVVDAEAPERKEWDPKHFTDPKSYDKKKPFRFIVWSLMNAYTGRGVSYQKILADPSIAKTFLLSTSVIDQDHRACYYPYGIILKVPQECIISTSAKDQSFKNYRAAAATPENTSIEAQLKAKVESYDMLSEIRRVAGGAEIDTPAEVLKATNKKGGSRGYNEVVVMGTSPEGKSVEPWGIYVKVEDEDDTPYIRNDLMTDKPEKAPYVTDEVTKLLDALSKSKKLPICYIVDTIK